MGERSEVGGGVSVSSFTVERDQRSGMVRVEGEPCLVQYIRNHFGEIYGVVVATWDGTSILYGYSGIRRGVLTQFDRDKGIELALQRAFSKPVKPPFDYTAVPQGDIRKSLRRLDRRASTYFGAGAPPHPPQRPPSMTGTG